MPKLQGRGAWPTTRIGRIGTRNIWRTSSRGSNCLSKDCKFEACPQNRVGQASRSLEVRLPVFGRKFHSPKLRVRNCHEDASLRLGARPGARVYDYKFPFHHRSPVSQNELVYME